MKRIRQVGFQETDIVDIVKPITKYSTIIKNHKIKSKLELAWTTQMKEESQFN